MKHTVYTVKGNELNPDIKEIFRYLKVSEGDIQIKAEIESCISEFQSIISPKAVFTESSAEICGSTVKFDFMEMESAKLSNFLGNKKRAFIFVATLGIKADMAINKYLRLSPSRGVIANAVCISLIEDFCDRLTGYLTGCERSCKRFSPGYGDLALEYQRELLHLLDAERKIGVTLTDTYLMLPEKSVSAIVGAD